MASLIHEEEEEEEGGTAQDSLPVNQPGGDTQHTSLAEAWPTARSLSAYTPTSQGVGQALRTRGQVTQVPQKWVVGAPPSSAPRKASACGGDLGLGFSGSWSSSKGGRHLSWQLQMDWSAPSPAHPSSVPLTPPPTTTQSGLSPPSPII